MTQDEATAALAALGLVAVSEGGWCWARRQDGPYVARGHAWAETVERARRLLDAERPRPPSQRLMW